MQYILFERIAFLFCDIRKINHIKRKHSLRRNSADEKKTEILYRQ